MDVFNPLKFIFIKRISKLLCDSHSIEKDQGVRANVMNPLLSIGKELSWPSVMSLTNYPPEKRFYS